jgi:hypothetical protein
MLAVTLTFGCADDEGGNPAATGTAPITGSATLNTGGGLGGSNGGSGGDGDYIEFYIEYGTGGDVVVTAAGSADASFTPSNITPSYGTNPLTFSANATVEYTPAAEPAIGTAYIAADNYLYVSDGDGTLGNVDADELPVTGMRVTAAATLTFGVAGDANVTLYLDNDFVNDGTVTTADHAATDRGNLDLYPATFLNRGTIALNATAAGQNGGNFYVDASEASYINQGPIETYGGDADGSDAGDGGDVTAYGEHYLENTGQINSYGGRATGGAGMGGDGGDVYLEADYWGDARNSATINSNGGDGVTGGGAGGYFYLYIEYTGDCINSGTANTWGGNTETGTGGDGGYVYFETWQGGVRNNADINANGGSATDAAGDAGDGGYFYAAAWSGTSDEPTPGYYTPTKDIEISGNIDLRGGNALASGSGSGGDGGYFYVEIDGDYWPLGQQIRLLGYNLLDTRGGDGNFGGDGGYVYAWQEYAYDEDNYYSPGGYYIDGTDIDTRGGNVVAGSSTTPAYGGNGGYVEFDMTLYTYVNATIVESDPMRLYMRGDINTSGGANLEGMFAGNSNAGYVEIYAKQGVEIDGSITARGGSDAGVTVGAGGDGGYVSLMADFGDVSVSGTIDMSGGDAALGGGDAGYTSDPTLATSQGDVSSGDIFAEGGNADALLAGSMGGDGQDFWLFSPYGPTSVGHGDLSALGGDGETIGSDGVVIAGGHIIEP